jgi:hypothetical protein
MSFTGTAAELDELLPDSIVSFVAGHLELKNTRPRQGRDGSGRESGTGRSAQQGEERQEASVGIGREGQSIREGRTK